MWVAYKLAQLYTNPTLLVVVMGFLYLGFVAIMATNTCCSIELEPKTLRQGQLYQARVTADVVQKMMEKEASTIFIKDEGKGSFIHIHQTLIQVMEEEEKLQKEDQPNIGNDKKSGVIERPCQCSLNSLVESPDQISLKEPLSAPF